MPDFSLPPNLTREYDYAGGLRGIGRGVLAARQNRLTDLQISQMEDAAKEKATQMLHQQIGMTQFQQEQQQLVANGVDPETARKQAFFNAAPNLFHGRPDILGRVIESQEANDVKAKTAQMLYDYRTSMEARLWSRESELSQIRRDALDQRISAGAALARSRDLELEVKQSRLALDQAKLEHQKAIGDLSPTAREAKDYSVLKDQERSALDVLRPKTTGDVPDEERAAQVESAQGKLQSARDQLEVFKSRGKGGEAATKVIRVKDTDYIQIGNTLHPVPKSTQHNLWLAEYKAILKDPPGSKSPDYPEFLARKRDLEQKLTEEPAPVSETTNPDQEVHAGDNTEQQPKKTLKWNPKTEQLE